MIQAWPLLAIVVCLFSSGVACGDSSAQVTTSYGVVTGYAGETSNRYVVPYAVAPTGDRRWTNPVAPSKIAGGVYDGTKLPPACAQSPSFISSTGSENEDCLFLTIYTPKIVKKAYPLPVFVWVHGGSNVAGSTTAPGLDGSALANSQNMIVVTVQYRLGLLGFLRLNALKLDGNYGLKDIIAALTYIKSEIAAFGGSDQITLAGQSSGAELIQSLLVTPSATNLFTRAIMHSPPAALVDQSIATADDVGYFAANATGCGPDLKCLRKSPVANLLAASSALLDRNGPNFAGLIEGASSIEPLRVNVDGILVTRRFTDVVASADKLSSFGKELIFTTVKDEGCLTTSGFAPYTTSDYIPYVVEESFGGDRSTSIAASGLYAPDSWEDFSRLITDSTWTCPVQQNAVNISLSQKQTVYLAEFDLGISYLNNPYCNGKVDHQDDIYALFGTSTASLTPAQIKMSNELQTRWAAFARNGSPNKVGLSPTWKTVWTRTQLNVLNFGATADGSSTTSFVQREDACQIGKGVWGRTIPYV